MSTIRISAAGVNSQSHLGAYAIGAGVVVATPSNAQVLQVVNKFPLDVSYLITPYTDKSAGQVRLNPNASGLFLNGSAVATDENHLPVGFHLDSAQVEISAQDSGTNDSTWAIVIGATTSGNRAGTFLYPTVPPLTLNYVLASLFGINFQAQAASNPIFYYIIITGVYSTYAYQFTISNGSSVSVAGQTGKLFLPGSGNGSSNTGPNGKPLVKLQSGLGLTTNLYSTATPTKTGLDLKGTYASGSGSGITSIQLTWTDPITGISTSATVNSANFLNWTTTELDIELVDSLSLPEDVWIILWLVSGDGSVGSGFPNLSNPPNGTTFSGSVKLGLLKILTTQASGIYRIVADKTNDTLYINNPNDNTTANFAFPDPFIKTGFIGG